MNLAAMMRLVIEEMRHGRCKPLADRPHGVQRRIAVASGKPLRIETVGKAADAFIFRLPLFAQGDEIVGNDRIEVFGWSPSFVKRFIQMRSATSR